MLKTRTWVGLALAVAFAPALATANQKFSYQKDSRDLYEAVVPGGTDKVKEKLGIYAVEQESGDLIPLVYGTLLGVNRSYRGVHTYASVQSGMDSAHDIFTVVDGYLTLLNFNSRPDQPESYIQFRPGSKIPVIDVLSGSEVQIPAIQNIGDVKIVEGKVIPASADFPNGGKLYYVSLKAPTMMGTGLTLAIMLSGSGTKDTPKLIGGHAILLGYSDLDNQALNRLATTTNPYSKNILTVYAPAVIKNLRFRLERAQDFPTVSLWRQQLDEMLTFIQTGKISRIAQSSGSLGLGVPTYDLLAGKPIYDQLPAELIAENGTRRIVQAYDPFADKFSLYELKTNANAVQIHFNNQVMSFYSKELLAQNSFFDGALDRISENGKFSFISPGHTDNGGGPNGTLNDSFLTFSKGGLNLGIRHADANDVTGSYQLIHLQKISGVKPGDRIEFLHSKHEINKRKIHMFMISIQGEDPQNSSVWNLIIEETGTMRALKLERILAGPFMTVEEMRLRLREQPVGEHVFDTVTPVIGAEEYSKPPAGLVLKKDEQYDGLKTVPYTRLLAGLSLSADNMTRQTYMRPLSERQMVGEKIVYREYDPTGAVSDATGFYALGKTAVGPSVVKDFIAGRPLFTKKEKGQGGAISHISETQALDVGNTGIDTIPTIQLSLFPFVQNPEEEKTKFKLGMAFTAAPDKAQLKHVSVPFPFASLAFTKILHGTKNRRDEYSVLMVFRKDDKIPNSANAVLSISGKIDRSALREGKFEMTVSDARIIQADGQPIVEWKTHLKMDAEGSFYWDADPSIAPDSSQKKVRKLVDGEKDLAPRSQQILNLRVAEHLKDGHVGYTNTSLRRGGSWEIYTKESMKNNIVGAKDLLEGPDEPTDKKDKKAAKASSEKELLNDFDKFLDTLAAPRKGRLNRMQVILVEETLVPKFRQAMIKKLGKKDGEFSIQSANFKFFYGKSELDDVEMADELRFINDVPVGKTSVLFLESGYLAQNKVVTRQVLEEEGDGATYEYGYNQTTYKPGEMAERFKLDNPDDPGSYLSILASGGVARTVEGFKKMNASEPKIPFFTIMSPKEWQNLQISQATAKEVAAGVLDRFDVNSDFLTSSWTMWPPGTDRTSDQVTALAKSPYNVEEMRVFPSLNKTLEDAANGKLKGKQKIIIVPEDLKELIQKMVLLRWATPDAKNSGVWHNSNRNLSLFNMAYASNDQVSIQDHFRSIRGAGRARNSVLLGDLETIASLGRLSTASGKPFLIRDPFEKSASLIGSDGDENYNDSDPSAGIDELEVDELNEKMAYYNEVVSNYKSEMEEIDRSYNAGEITAEDYNRDYSAAMEQRDRYWQARQQIVTRLSKLVASGATASATRAKGIVPHMLWWLTAEGQMVQPDKDKNWKLSKAVRRQSAALLIGTEDELARLESDMSFENKFFNLRENFDIEYLQPPDEEAKLRLVKSLFDQPEISSLGIEFVIDSPGAQRDPQTQLIYRFFNRVDQIAYDQKMEKTTAFIKAFTALKNALFDDPVLRRTRQIDERFLERLFTTIFPMPLNKDILEPGDPILRLSNVDGAVRQMEKLGYRGSPDLKRRSIETVLSQTRPTDPSRPIPNSQIFFGKTSKGKTFFIETLFKMMNLVEYKPNKATNADADYIFIKVANLTADANNTDPEKVDVREVIDQIYDLLSQPKGARAHIVFDDFHKAISKEVRATLFQFIQGLFEAKNGMISVTDYDGVVKEIPVQNLNLYMTLNPASSEKARDQYIRPGTVYPPAELLKREVLAAIADGGFTPEESVLARWADIINIDNFPRSASVPELGIRVRAHSRSSRDMILVDAEVIDALARRFDGANAREFLAPATSALTTIPYTAAPSLLYLVSLRKSQKGDVPRANVGQINLQGVSAAVREMTQIDPVNLQEPKSMLSFMSYLMKNFRLLIFNSLALNAHMGDALKLEKTGLTNILKINFLLGVSSHVLTHPKIPEGQMVISPDQLSFFDQMKTKEFYEQFAKLKTKEKYFPINIGQKNYEDLDLDRFLDGRAGPSTAPRTRMEVINQYVLRIEAALAKVLALHLRLQSPLEIRDMGRWSESQIREWFGRLSETNPEEPIRLAIEEILNIFTDFQIEFNSPDLRDLLEPQPHSSTLYDEVRLFSYMVDKALTLLPWGSASKFVYDVVEQSKDFSLGTKTSFKEYIGIHEFSPFANVTPEFMNEVSNIAKSISQGSAPQIESLQQGFGKMCESLLGGKKVSP